MVIPTPQNSEEVCVPDECGFAAERGFVGRLDELGSIEFRLAALPARRIREDEDVELRVT
jgi:hypothetical protein